MDDIKEIILEAGDIFKKGFYNLKNVSFKGKKDLVTEYDVAVEDFLKASFKKILPDFTIIAEESSNNIQTINNTIIIDPIDGTTNFVNGLPHCAISVAIYKDGEEYIGAVYLPILNEFFYAKKGEGAFLNDEKISVSKEADFEKSLIATGFPYTCGESEKDLEFIIDRLKKVLPNCQDIRRLGSASVDLCMVAKGVFEAYYEIGLASWDLAGGMIILKEAGGLVTDIDGKELNLFDHKCLVSSNGKIHQKLINIIK
jgi:myo-inositol-1(or 4)-monophosphatase